MGKQAVLVVGGYGTRLSSVVTYVPKPMAKVSEIPFLDYLINHLKENGFDSFIFLTGYKSEIIENYYKDLNGAVFIKENTPLGTGGAVLNAYEYLNEDFYIINGDTFFDIDFSLADDFTKNKSATLILRYSDNISRYGYVDIDDNYIIKTYIEKGKLPNNKIDGYINSGILYLRKEVLKPYYNEYDGQFVSMEKDIFPKLIEKKLLYALPLGGCFIDIGIPEDYTLAQKIIPERIKQKSKPALFIDKDGTIIENTSYPSGRDLTIINKTIDIVKEYKKKDYYIVMVTNQAGIAKGKFTFNEMNECFDEISKIYKDFGINFNKIMFCPYHIDGIIDKYKYDTLLRKPNPGMILKACEDLKINLKESIMIGDNSDIDNIKLPYLKCITLEEK